MAGQPGSSHVIGALLSTTLDFPVSLKNLVAFLIFFSEACLNVYVCILKLNRVAPHVGLLFLKRSVGMQTF